MNFIRLSSKYQSHDVAFHHDNYRLHILSFLDKVRREADCGSTIHPFCLSLMDRGGDWHGDPL